MSTAAWLLAVASMAVLCAWVLALALCRAAALGDRQLAQLDPPDDQPTRARAAKNLADPDQVPRVDLFAVRADDQLIEQVRAGVTPPHGIGRQLAALRDEVQR